MENIRSMNWLKERVGVSAGELLDIFPFNELSMRDDESVVTIKIVIDYTSRHNTLKLVK